jgi:hypothetical protein
LEGGGGGGRGNRPKFKNNGSKIKIKKKVCIRTVCNILDVFRIEAIFKILRQVIGKLL